MKTLNPFHDDDDDDDNDNDDDDNDDNDNDDDNDYPNHRDRNIISIDPSKIPMHMS